jgi:hypothetical protein
MKYIFLLNIFVLVSCQRLIDDTHKAEQVLHDVEVCEEQIAKDLAPQVYTVQKGNP